MDYYVSLLVRSIQISNPLSDSWRQTALPFAEQALSIAEQDKEAHQEDLATALETKAEVLGQTPQAKRLWKRSTEIRRRLVDELIRMEKSTPCPDKPNSDQPESLPSAPYQRSAALSFVVDSSGRPTQIRLIRSVGFGLDEAAAKAVRCWRFKPGTAGGHAVSVPATVQINFRMLWPAIEEEGQRTKQTTGAVQETIVR